LIFYYGSSSYGKNNPYPTRVSGGGIFRARLRMDGFVSLDAGSLTTKLLKFKGSNLYLNAIGPVIVEVIDENENTIASKTVQGDSILQLVNFQGHNLLKIANGEKIRLRFVIKEGGKLFSFTIK